jgi:hypothetical protein
VSPLGLGPVPEAVADARVVVRQPGAVATGAFLALMFGTMAVAVLIEPSIEGGSGNAFLDRWVFGAIVIPAAFGIHRFLLRPRIVVDDEGVRLVNAFSSCALPWADVAGARGGGPVELVGIDGDCARSLVYGPAFSGPLTGDRRPRALVALIRSEAARRAGREPPTEDYAATPLVADDAASYAPVEPVIHPRPSYGVAEAVMLVLGWTLACAVAAGLT